MFRRRCAAGTAAMRLRHGSSSQWNIEEASHGTGSAAAAALRSGRTRERRWQPERGQDVRMSFCCLVGGVLEPDAPGCASPVIRTFAILINDQMPGEVRQRLKPFAPSIVGTKDGLDEARAEILRRALVGDFPRGVPLPDVGNRSGGVCGSLCVSLLSQMLHHRIDYLLNQGESRRRRPDYAVQVASAAASLLGFCARSARNADETEW